jgi:hypothetical protein
VDQLILKKYTYKAPYSQVFRGMIKLVYYDKFCCAGDFV